MDGMNELTRIGGRDCALVGDPGAAAVLVQPVDWRELDGMADEAAQIREKTDAPFLLAAFAVENWDDELSPWPAPAAFGDGEFGGAAQDTLEYALGELIPAVEARCPAREAQRWLLGGYSLAGLFALWASARTDRFSGVAAVSPSVWYPGWLDFARRNPTRAGRVYLSLGDREEKARNPVMARVGDAVREQYALLKGGPACVLEWNPGNHFADPEGRTAKGFAWLLG